MGEHGANLLPAIRHVGVEPASRGGLPPEPLALYRAALLSDEAKVKRIVAAAPNVARRAIREPSGPQAQLLDGLTPLYCARTPGMARALLGAGADANPRAEDLRTPLHDAGRSGDAVTISVLQRHGASLDARARLGRTPLRLAAVFAGSDAVGALLDSVANPLLTDHAGLAPVNGAVVSGNLRALARMPNDGPAMPLCCDCGSPMRAVARSQLVEQQPVRVADPLLASGESINTPDSFGSLAFRRCGRGRDAGGGAEVALDGSRSELQGPRGPHACTACGNARQSAHSACADRRRCWSPLRPERPLDHAPPRGTEP